MMNDAAAFNKAQDVPWRRWVILLLVYSIYLLVSADRANLGIAIPFITKEYGISHAQAGLLLTLMFSLFTVAQIPAGFLCKKIGPRYLMALSLAFTSSVSFVIAASHSFKDIEVSRALLGIFEAPITICCVSIINYWFSTKEKGRTTGFLFASSKLGPVICPPISVLVLNHYGWRAVFELFAVPVGALAVIWVIFVRDQPRKSVDGPAEITDRAPSVGLAAASDPEFGRARSRLDFFMRRKKIPRITTPRDVFRSWNILGVALGYLCMAGVLNVMMAWMPSYLLTAKHLSTTDMSFLSGVPFAGAVCGNLAGGWISDNFLHSRWKPLMMAGAALTSMMFVFLIYAPDDVMFIAVLLFLLGTLFGVGYPGFSVYPMGITEKDVYPLAFGVVNSASAFGAAIFPLVTGLFLDHFQWWTVFLFLSVSLLVCVAILATVDEPILD